MGKDGVVLGLLPSLPEGDSRNTALACGDWYRVRRCVGRPNGGVPSVGREFKGSGAMRRGVA